jgi:hypothetical protein
MMEQALRRVGRLSSLAVRGPARCWRRTTEKATRAAFAAGLGLSGVLTTSSTAPALLEAGSLRASDAGTVAGAGLRLSMASPPMPEGLIVEYRPVRGAPEPSADEPYGDGVPIAVRTPISDHRLFTATPAAASNGDADDSIRRSGTPSRRKVSNSARSPAVPKTRGRKAASPWVTGCSRCTGPAGHAPHGSANLFASLFLKDIFLSGRPIRRENRPSGAAQQRTAPHLTVWFFQRT